MTPDSSHTAFDHQKGRFFRKAVGALVGDAESTHETSVMAERSSTGRHDAPRIVSLFPAATEMICAIGLADALVGVSHECNWPAEVTSLPSLTRSRVDSAADSAAIDAQVKSLLAAGEDLYELDAQLLAALRPTLIVAQAQCEVCALSAGAVQSALRAGANLSATDLIALNPRSLDDVLVDLESIGRAAGHEKDAHRFSSSLRQRIGEVRRQVAAGPAGPRPRVAVIEWIDPLMVAGHWTPELVALAGGDYGLAAPGRPSPYVPWPELLSYAPERIVVAPCGFDLGRTRREATALENRPGWSTLPAVQAGRVLLVDGDAYFNRPGPRLVDVLELLAAWLGGLPASCENAAPYPGALWRG
jgi:iron complex transport system substrate-binding protein